MKKETGKNKKVNKKSSLVFSILAGLIAISLVVFGLWELSGEGKKPGDKLVFIVGKEEVYLDEVNLYCLENVVQLGITVQQLDNVKADDGTLAPDYYKEEILKLIMDTKVTYMEACKKGITLTPEEETAVKEDAMAYISSVGDSILNQFGITKDTVLESYKQRCIAKKLTDSIVADMDVEEHKYATIYMMMFPKVEIDDTGDYVRDTDGESPVLLSESRIQQRQEDAEAALLELKEGADAEQVAKKYGVELVSGQESNLIGSFGEPFDKYITPLKEGDCSPVIDIESCYVIIQMLDENNEQLAEQIMSVYRSDQEKETIAKAVEEWYKDMGVSSEPEFDGRFWEQVSLYDFARYVEE